LKWWQPVKKQQQNSNSAFMAKRHFRVKPYKHPRLKFVVRSKVTGKWERRFFQTKAEAET
jgi:hypothetical protein